MEHVTFLVVAVVVAALAFDFTNGFHDTANAMATSIATGALRPRTAVLVSGALNLAGAFLSTEVAKTISDGIVDDSLVTPGMVLAGLVGAILWNLATWLLGLPSSSSHALFGGLIGAVWVGAGVEGVHFSKVLEKILIPALASPLIAGLAALCATYLAYRIAGRARGDAGAERVGRGFRAGQIASASLVSLAHGTNDAQKTMGVITLTLVASGALPHGSGPPVWVIGSAGLAIALGTYLGGWRIIRTMGRGLTDIKPPQGFAAETAATSVILASAHLGFALSTTHVCSGGVVGAGLGRRTAEIRWGTAGRMLLAWCVTLPAAAAVGGLAALAVVRGGTPGTVLVLLAAAAVTAALVLLARRNAVHSGNVNDEHRVSVRPAPAEPAAA
ncbi:anion permease [Streptomyces sp. NPDC048182]|uniref:inorganic phosphate transporter n=1 Tax=Streptomyces sp. NPDC048182 TaxID=3365507 RepID=UPI003715309D